MFQGAEDPAIKYNVALIGIVGTVVTATISLIIFFLNRKLERMKIDQQNELAGKQKELDKWKTEQQDKWESAKIHQGLELERIRSKQQSELEQLKNQLQEQTSEKDARRDYEYEARKRLYQHCEPLLFQLVEASESGCNRIYSLARSARKGKLSLTPGEGWLQNPDRYYLSSTVYKLLAPLAIYRVFQNRLTLVDLTLSPHTNALYQLTKRLFISFTDEFTFASYEPVLEYEPNLDDQKKLRLEKPAKYCRQGLFIGFLENAVDKMIISDQNGNQRCMNYGEFESVYKSEQVRVSEDFWKVARLFYNFHPFNRPVLWRLLVTQAHIYEALIRTKDLEVSKSDKSIKEILAPAISEMKTKLDWRDGKIEVSDDEVLVLPFDIATKYLQDNLRDTFTSNKIFKESVPLNN